MDDRIISKMKKLLAMSQDSSSEQEAMIATKALHALLAKHNVSMSAVEKDEEDVGQISLEEQINWPWKRIVLNNVCKLYFCKGYFQMTRKNHAEYYVVGTDANRMFCQSIILTIFRVIEMQAKVESKKVCGKIDSGFVTSFRTGASHRIGKRCRELIELGNRGELNDDEGNTLPALFNTYKLNWEKADTWMTGEMGEMKEVKAITRSRHHTGYHKGQSAGDKVGLHRGIQSENSPKMIGAK